jgi:magnesium transporter
MTAHEDRERARHSIAGPVLSTNSLFMSSPLSSSLSAVVAELRRGNSVRSSNLRHVGSIGGGGSGSQSRRSTIGQEDEDGERRRSAAEASVRQGSAEAGAQGKSVRRGRSLSGTLGELFRWMEDGGVDAGTREERQEEGRAHGGSGSGAREQR